LIEDNNGKPSEIHYNSGSVCDTLNEHIG